MALYRFGTPSISGVISTLGSPIQGVCVDPAGGRYWVSLSSELRRYNGSWVQQTSQTTTSDSPTDKSQVNGMAYDGTTLFVGANNFNSASPKKGWILEYDPTTLARVAEHAVEAHWAEGCAIREESGSPEYWVHYHDWTSVSRYDSSWTLIGNYALPGISIYSTALFQGGFWSGDHLYLVRHNESNPTMYYVYLWDGTGFDLVEARDAPFLTADYAGQGFSFDEANLTAYWARRIVGAVNAPDVLETAMVPYAPATPSPNAWTFITSGMIQGADTGKSVTIDTTGADLIFIQINAAAATTPAVTDSFGNTVNALTAVTTTSNRRLYRYYITPSSVGRGHQFTATGVTFDSMMVSAFSGAAASPLDLQSTADGATSAGAITPSEDNCLVIASLCSRDVADYTIGSSYEITERRRFVSAICDGGATAYLAQTTAASTNPAWSNSGAVALVSFKPGFSPGTSVTVDITTTGAPATSTLSASVSPVAALSVSGANASSALSVEVSPVVALAADGANATSTLSAEVSPVVTLATTGAGISSTLSAGTGTEITLGVTGAGASSTLSAEVRPVVELSATGADAAAALSAQVSALITLATVGAAAASTLSATIAAAAEVELVTVGGDAEVSLSVTAATVLAAARTGARNIQTARRPRFTR